MVDDTEDGGRVKMKVGSPQTVNIAEIVAQYAAIHDTPHDEHLTVYTDSKCSLRKLQGWIRDPKNMEGDKHENIVRDVATMVAHR